jgi:hypothetical protein
VKRSASLLSLLIVVGCASTHPVNLKEARRVVGTDNGVRVDGQILGDQLTPNTQLGLSYDVTNQRATPILIADLIPQANYDPDTQMVTIDIGTEIPGAEFLPRLIPIQSGQKKSFATGVHVIIRKPLNTPWQPRPNAVRLKINFLDETKPFEKLIAIPERAVRDPQLADQLFAKWVERNETVFTNALPMRWVSPSSDEGAQSPRAAH